MDAGDYMYIVCVSNDKFNDFETNPWCVDRGLEIVEPRDQRLNDALS